MTAYGLAIIASLLAAPQDPPTRAVRVSAVEGTVTWQGATESAGHPAVVNTVLSEGDALTTADNARAELHLGSIVVSMAPKSRASIRRLTDTAFALQLQQGSVNVTAKVLPAEQHVEIDAENAAVQLRQVGHTRVSLDPNAHRASVAVRDGEIALHLGTQTQAMHTNDSVMLSRLEPPVIGDATARDAFDAWCDDREQHAGGNETARYVARDVEGAEDLEGHGKWIDTTDGKAWMPSDTAQGWAPYTQGEWQWSDVYGWTWVDDASWGYATSHYGRWGYYDDQWAWVPGPTAAPAVYAPALVAFMDINAFADGLVATWAYAAWFALAPKEPFIPGYAASQAYLEYANPGVAWNTVPCANRNAPFGVVAVRDKVLLSGQKVAASRQALSSQATSFAPATGSYASVLPGETRPMPPARIGRMSTRSATAAINAPPVWATQRRERLVQTFQTAATHPVFRTGVEHQPKGRDYAEDHRVPPPPRERPEPAGSPAMDPATVRERPMGVEHLPVQVREPGREPGREVREPIREPLVEPVRQREPLREPVYRAPEVRAPEVRGPEMRPLEHVGPEVRGPVEHMAPHHR